MDMGQQQGCFNADHDLQVSEHTASQPAAWRGFYVQHNIRLVTEKGHTKMHKTISKS